VSAEPQPEHQLALALPEQLVQTLAERIAALLLERQGEAAGVASPWLDVNGAASYLGFSRDRLYKLTAARAIPFRKKRGGQGLLFHRGELDRWLESQYLREGWQG
jgi:excisionase family DNA binding protein